MGGHPLAVHFVGSILTGTANAATLKNRSKVRSSRDRFGFPTISGTAASPPPVKLTDGELFMVIAKGLPGMKLVMSETCQPSATARTIGFGSSRLSFGTSHRKWKVKTSGRSYAARP